VPIAELATARATIGAEIAARLNLELGAKVQGRFAPGQGAQLEIDPFVNASLDVIASLIATLYAEVCWFTVIDKKWKLASVNLAHINLGSFRPFKPVGLQVGGPGGTKLTQGLALHKEERGRVPRPDTKATSAEGAGLQSRDETVAAPTPLLPTDHKAQQVYRGLDAFTMDEETAFCQRARLKINMPLGAGASGSTVEQINVAMTMGLAGADLQ
jgi:hypothetical protein